MTCFVEEKKINTHTQHFSEAETEKKTQRNKYLTLFLLKDEAALIPFVREVMQNCTTKYHPRPKCGTNIHRYINIKVSPIQHLANFFSPHFHFAPT